MWKAKAIRQWFLDYTQIMQSTVKYLRHKITCPWIVLDGDAATAFSYLDVDAASKDTGRVIITACRYEDRLVKLDGQWCLKEKSIFMDDTYIINL
ncbi:MAG: nuclear transport factor 2 family protein [Thermodesulfobacteriota bacterium]|nr:nuclear transport factor 2 family protein [Thermodesulfobacteriota bacterium]